MGEYKVLLVDECPHSNAFFLKEAERLFGGYTEGPGCRGVWRDPETKVVHSETVFPVYIATDNTSDVIKLASEYKHHADQVCVYVRHPNGMVQFV